MPGKTSVPRNSLIQTLHRLGGYYNCPTDPEGVRLGPLVGYAGRYFHDGEYLQYVGEEYANCSVLREYPWELFPFSGGLARLIRRRYLKHQAPKKFVFCAAPEGGKVLAHQLSYILRVRYIHPDKEVVKQKTATSREVSRLVWGQHEVEEGTRAIIVEDVINNFSTTAELVGLIESRGATVECIVGLLNRSSPSVRVFSPNGYTPIPVEAFLHRPMNEWRQDDPLVADDIARGNVVWNPKKPPENWHRLMEAMKVQGRRKGLVG